MGCGVWGLCSGVHGCGVLRFMSQGSASRTLKNCQLEISQLSFVDLKGRYEDLAREWRDEADYPQVDTLGFRYKSAYVRIKMSHPKYFETKSAFKREEKTSHAKGTAKRRPGRAKALTDYSQVDTPSCSVQFWKKNSPVFPKW